MKFHRSKFHLLQSATTYYIFFANKGKECCAYKGLVYPPKTILLKNCKFKYMLPQDWTNIHYNYMLYSVRLMKHLISSTNLFTSGISVVPIYSIPLKISPIGILVQMQLSPLL